MRTKLRSKFTLLFLTLAIVLAVPAIAFAQDLTGSTSPVVPTIQSDKADYAPGELVTLTGSNWTPGEPVNIVVNDDVGQTWNRNVNVIADPSGNISDSFNLPDWFVATYTVTATGSSGTATTTFTDGNINVNPIRVPATGFQTVTAGTSYDFTVKHSKQGGGNDPIVNLPVVVTQKATGNLAGQTCGGAATQIPSSWLSVVSPTLPQTISQASPGGTDINFRVSPPANTPSGNYTGAINLTTTDGGAGPFDLCLTVPAAPTSVNTTTTASNASATYGGSSVTLNSTVTAASGPAVNTGTVTFTVKKGATTIGTVTSGTVAAGSASASFPLSGVNADTYTIEAAYNAGTGFNASNNSTQSPAPTLTVDKASSTTTVTCGAGPFTYDGSAKTPCTAAVTGAGGLSQPLTVSYANNTGAGQATASASFAGDANHNSSSDSKNFTIDKASSNTTVSCPASVTYDSTPKTPCTVSVTGAGGLNLSPAADYANNTNAGTATASYTYAGDANHNGSSGSKTFAIDKANATINVNGYTGTYDGNAHGATGTATGVGGADLSSLLHLGASYTNVPGGTANWTFDGNNNYNSKSGSVAIVISKATPQITWSNPAAIDYGTLLSATQLNATANVSGMFSYVPPAGTKLLSGTHDLTANFTPMDTTNYNDASKTVQIVVNAYPFNGFFQPIDNGGVFNKAKIGSTIPVKFSLGGDKGLNIFAAGYPQVSKPIACGSNPAVDAVEEYSTATNSGLKYDSAANQYIYNWKTESTIKAGECRQLIVKLADGSVAKTANFTFFK
jgi:hypothetical protein